MSDLNDFFKAVSVAKATDPKHKLIEDVKKNVASDITELFVKLSSGEVEEKEIDKIVEDIKAIELIEETIKIPEAEDIPILEGEETQAMEAIDHTDEVLKLLKNRDDAIPFQQPNPDPVAKDLKVITDKIRFLEQWLGKISAHGPGSGEVNLRYLDDVDSSTIQNGYALVYNASKDKFEFVDLRAETALIDTGEPMGHVNRLESSITFNNSTRTFTISPVGAYFNIYTRGVKRTITQSCSVTIPNTTDLYYIYFDTDGILQYRTQFFDWPNDCMTAYVYWNSDISSAPFVADERHGIILDWQTHEYLHRTRGAAFANGFTASNYILNGDGSLATHCELDLTGGTFFDEDLQVDIVHSNTPSPNTWEQDLQGPAKIPIFYHYGTAWRIDSPTNYPLKMGATRPVYNYRNNGTWSVQDIQSNKFGVTMILATNNINYPVIGIIGQQVYDTIGLAQALDYNELNLEGFPVVELRPLYRIIYQVKDTFTNAVKSALVEVKDLRKDLAVQVV